MELTVGILKKIIADLPDDVILADLRYGNDEFHPMDGIKRVLLLQSFQDGKKYLTINGMGSHFTQQGDQRHLNYLHQYWDDDTLK